MFSLFGVPAAHFIDTVYGVGSTTGKVEDKFASFGIETVASPELDIPVIEKGCVAWLECRLLPEPGPQDRYDTCFGEVVSAAADERYLRTVCGISTRIISTCIPSTISAEVLSS